MPTHSSRLHSEWGRGPDAAAGDLLGLAWRRPGLVVIEAYYGGPVPAEILDWFRTRYPDAEIRS